MKRKNKLILKSNINTPLSLRGVLIYQSDAAISFLRPSFILFIIFLFSTYTFAQTSNSKTEQLKQMQNKQILVAMWGWPVEEMAPAAKRFGYEAVNSPHGNDLEKIKREVAVWSQHSLKMIARPAMPAYDPFDPNDIKQGCEKLNEIIKFYDTCPDVIAIVISWGLFGEGGFPWDYKFTEKAKLAFNKYMNLPAQKPLPCPPKPGQPGSLKWVQWLEFRAKTLVNFRKTFLASAKQHTNKLIGTWSEVYPNEHYALNMGNAPGTDFMFYDLSFGDVTCNQQIAFGECHGDMQHFDTFEKWRNHELPLMAKAAGQGVIPIAFQFPMRRGHAVDFLAETKVFIDNIEDEYSLKIGPDIRKLIDAIDHEKIPTPQVALVYNSFAAAALPCGKVSDELPNQIEVQPFYNNIATKQIEGLLHQMGVNYIVIPYEFLEHHDLTKYNVLIIPDPLYLNNKMRENLTTANRTLYLGEYLLAHRDPNTQRGSYLPERFFHAETHLPKTTIKYLKAPQTQLLPTKHKFLEGITIDPNHIYPSDQMFAFDPLPEKYTTILNTKQHPAIITTTDLKQTFITNRLPNHAWHSDSDTLEKFLYKFLRNYLTDANVDIRIKTAPLHRVRTNRFYGPYGLTGNIAWNTTDTDITLELNDGTKITVPKFNWTKIK